MLNMMLKVYGIIALASPAFAAGSHKIPARAALLSEPTIACPPGYEGPIEGRCTRQIYQPTKAVCADGILAEDGQHCLILLPPIPVCPNPDFLLSHGARCQRTSTTPSLLGCADPDFVLEGGGKHKSATVCVKSVTTVPESPRPIIIEEVSLPDLVCPAGTDLDPHSGLCYSVEISTDCPQQLGGGSKHKHRLLLDSDTLNNAQVEGEAEARALGHAPKKIKFLQTPERVSVSVVSQTCERKRVLPPALSCRFSQKLIGRECVSTTNSQPIPLPPVVSVITAPPVTSCPPTYVPCGAGVKHTLNSKKISSDCCSVTEAPADLTCPRGFQLAGDHCEAFTAPEFVCREAGYTKHKKGECIFTESVPATVSYSTEITTTLDYEHHHHHQHK